MSYKPLCTETETGGGLKDKEQIRNNMSNSHIFFYNSSVIHNHIWDSQFRAAERKVCWLSHLWN